MSRGRWSVRLVAAVGALAAIVAVVTIWLLLTDPVRVASAVSSGDIRPILEAIGAALLDAARAITGLF